MKSAQWDSMCEGFPHIASRAYDMLAVKVRPGWVRQALDAGGARQCLAPLGRSVSSLMAWCQLADGVLPALSGRPSHHPPTQRSHKGGCTIHADSSRGGRVPAGGVEALTLLFGRPRNKAVGQPVAHVLLYTRDPLGATPDKVSVG